MKILAWLLGVLAIVGSCVLAVNWSNARKGVKEAAAAVASANDTLAGWQTADALRRTNLRRWIETDQMKVESGDTEVQIARLEGRSTSAAYRKLDHDEYQLRVDKEALRAAERLDEVGGGPNIRMSEERVAAADASASVYTACGARDEKFAYALGVVWLAFGFATALAVKKA